MEQNEIFASPDFITETESSNNYVKLFASS